MITVAEVKSQSVIDHDDDDSLLSGFVVPAAESAVANFTNRVMDAAEQVQILDGFPPVITLEKAPYISITSIKYNDVDDVEQTLASSGYTVDSRGMYATITPVYGSSWPSTTAAPQSVTVTYQAGYDSPPAALKQAALMIAASLYDLRENHIVGTTAASVPISAEYIMQPYRIPVL